MKLKKTWMGICVFVIYLVGIIFATGVTGFVSGPFSGYGQMADGAIMAAGAVVAGFVMSLLGSVIFKGARENSKKEPAVLIDILIPIAVAVIGIVVYINSISANLTGGNMALYEGAKVTGNALTPVSTSFADYAYMVGLRATMLLLGNGTLSVIVYQVVLRALLILFTYISLRITIGMAGALVCSALMIAIPVFAGSLSVVESGNITLATLALDILLVVLFAKRAAASDRKIFDVIFLIFCGVFTGYAVFTDVAALSVLVFVLTAFFIISENGQTKNTLIYEILFVLFGIISFVLCLIGWYGTGSFTASFWKWANQFYGINNSAFFGIIAESLQSRILVLVLLACGVAAAFSYIFAGRNERVIPWFLYIVTAAVLSVVLGTTATNNQIFILVLMTVATGCMVSGFFYKKSEEVAVSEEETEPENAIESETSETDDGESEKTAEPETDINEAEKTEESREAEDITEETVEPENTEESRQKPRFVPEGMVLPMGEEDEDNLEPNFNFKRQEENDIGVLEINRKVSKPKDEFDISIEPGDDFDI